MNQLFRTWIKRYFSNPQVVILAFLLVIGLLFIIFLGDMLTPVIAAVIVAYMLEGLVELLERHHVSRVVGVPVVFILFVLCILGIFVLLLPMLSRQIAQLIYELPGMLSDGQDQLMQLPQKYPQYFSAVQIQEIIQFISGQITGLARQVLSFSLASVRGAITGIVYLVLVPFLVFFFLKDKEVIVHWSRSILPDNRRLASEVWAEVNQQMANYIRGKVLEIIIVWSVTFIVFRIMELRFAMLLGILVGLSVLIPYIGATVMTLPVALIAFFQWGMTADFAYVVIAYGIIQLLDGNLLAPLLLSRVVNLHPIAVIVAILFFGGIWGFMGLFFAIPLATLIHAVMKAWSATIARDQVELDEVRILSGSDPRQSSGGKG
ncbi:MAG: AI-2E family transporter [Desulfobacterales bacterium]